ncbi:tetratricopeptide repeat protein [Phyllobacterium sp. 0TCS1.6C]|uniref:tetratricopeptide repeat protein n=1 Tax=unclassified Phyllobacterium TaxID=2638441 RepID=UPI00226463B8|nr:MULTISPECIES: tetratricopeptide repeat protein [unclassified Phyllobacterium]MCX8280279.1 tetratricopeptide repeat protein [Phyllobacterium sp. 0TCS1.6C]MCX8294160.1 tetratricopeptide repeat protein [Phyllobacterium sp. 0TCS1.6A]
MTQALSAPEMVARGFRLLAVALGLGFVLAGCTTTEQTEKKTAKPPSSEQSKLLNIARDVEAKGESGTALALYERAAEMSSSDSTIHVKLGNARLKNGDSDGAEKAYRSALQINPQDAHALLGLGTIQLQRGEADAAARTLAPAAQAINSVSAYNKLGTALILSGQGPAAESAFAKALALQPGNLDTKTNLALAQALSNKLPEASAGMNAVVSSPLAEKRHYVNYMIVLSLSGDMAAAKAVQVPDMAAGQKNQILAKASRLRSIQSPAERAQAIGVLAST